jgi:hypothetical protein
VLSASTFQTDLPGTGRSLFVWFHLERIELVLKYGVPNVPSNLHRLTMFWGVSFVSA